MGDSVDTRSITAQRWLRAVVGSLALAAIIFSATAVVVREGEAALITRFGRPLRAATEAGLHWKLPFPIDRVSMLDMRRRIYETGHTEMLTRDKKNMIARTFVVWRIGDPLAFTQAIGNEGAAEPRLDGLLTNASIGTLGGHDLSAMVSTNPADLQMDQIEAELLAASAPVAFRSYGVTIEQIRLERIALPEENVTAVFDQMRAERRQFAAKFDAEGELEASRIRSAAELEAAQIRAKGAEEQAKIRGESAAKVAKTYADAHKTDPELYRFTRSLEAVDKLVSGNATLILRTDSEPFSILQSNAPGETRKAGETGKEGQARKESVSLK
jgi:membrane protease subunit HflC